MSQKAPAHSQANGVSDSPVLSADGRFVAFEHLAATGLSILTSLLTSSARPDHGVTTLVSVNVQARTGNNSSDSPSISDDGNIVAFRSFASDPSGLDNNGNSDVYVQPRHRNNQPGQRHSAGR